MDKLQKFFSLVKVDEAQRLVYGLVTAERRDSDGETCHYESTKAEYLKASEDLAKVSDGENIMPLREMHQLKAVGAGKSITFDDANKQILMAFKVVDDSTWNKVLEKVLLGFSHSGKYLRRWTEGVTKFYTTKPIEVSLVDRPCLPGAYIEYAKAEGGVEFFRPKGDDDYASKADVSDLHTELKEIRALFNRHVDNSQTGDDMKPEDIKKCAAALGITEEEFAKRYVAAEDLEKAKQEIAALNEKAEKAAKAKTETEPEVLTKAEGQKLIEDTVAKAVKEALDKKVADDEAAKAKIFAVKRGEGATKVDSSSPYPGVV